MKDPLAVAMAESVRSGSAGQKALEAPQPPIDMVDDLPADYVARKCRRCGNLGANLPGAELDM